MSAGFDQAVYLAGPTAVGKSAVALELAIRLGGEIISVDSMQVYRGLDIGTAKPSAEERERVAHHLIDIVDLTDTFDAASFVRLSAETARDISSRNRVPIFCGGTGLYFKALLQGVSHAPPPDPSLRSRLERTPLPSLLEELEKNDPQTFTTIDRDNLRRVVRAVEAIRLTGRPFSEQQSDWKSGQGGECNFFALSREADDLRHRIDERVEKMFSQGLIPETRSLLEAGLESNRTAMQAIGYRQVVEHLNGMRPLNETIELVKSKTWQLARRQMTWLRNQLHPSCIAVTRNAGPSEIADEIAANARFQARQKPE